MQTSGALTVTNAVETSIAAYERRGGKSLDLMNGKTKNYTYPELGPLPVGKLTKGRIERWLYGVAEKPSPGQNSPWSPTALSPAN